MKMEVSGVAMRGRDEIDELDLSLSIGGGSFRKLFKKSISVDEGGCMDKISLSKSGMTTMTMTMTTTTTRTLVSDGDDNGESVVMDSKGKVEINALQRREAKRKREEKKQRSGRGFGSGYEELELEQECEESPSSKKEKQDDVKSECVLVKNVDPNLTGNSTETRDYHWTAVDPAAQMPYPYPNGYRYVPFANGYAFPCVMPYWTVGATINHGGDGTLHQPVVCRPIYKPFPMNQNITDVSLANGCRLEQNGGMNKKTESHGSSPTGSSSVVSDNYQSSSSHEGGSSSNNNTRSNSSHSSSAQHQMPGVNDAAIDDRTQGQASSQKFVKSHISISKTDRKEVKEDEEKVIMKSEKQERPLTRCKLSLNTDTVKSNCRNELKKVKEKAPIMAGGEHAEKMKEMMPCVTTRGIGGNGKTISGLLYRYSKVEVSILCVCHGQSFSPAEFVKHAGGDEEAVSNPLRHITVLPS